MIEEIVALIADVALEEQEVVLLHVKVSYLRFCNTESRLEAPTVVVEVTVEGGLIGGLTVRVVILVMVF